GRSSGIEPAPACPAEVPARQRGPGLQDRSLRQAMGISDVVRLHARQRPAKDAIVDGERHVTYRSLDRRVNGLCFALRQAGIASGDFVGVGLGDGADHLIALLALSRLGAVIVPIEPRWNDAEK